MPKHITIIAACLWAAVAWIPSLRAEESVEQWGIFELELRGSTTGNPFVEVELSARFTQAGRSVQVTGFYDGGGIYRLRFMPDAQGEWRYQTSSNRPELARKTGSIRVLPPSGGNHGPVRVHNTYHFAYAEGKAYFPVGTTCYAWIHQKEAVVEQTLKTLKAGPFNKLRLCVFPKWYAYNRDEPPRFPFLKSTAEKWDHSRWDVTFFRHLEQQVGRLRELGIEADLILFHPYDQGHWGFDRLPAEVDDRYLKYVVARLSAYRNVWWSLANEFDFMKQKSAGDWERFLRIVADNDPYGRLRSIHNGTLLFNHSHPLISHASIQNGSAVADFGRAVLYRDVYRKPIIFDEVKYEGDIPERWGNLSAEEMVHRCWQGTIAGTYVGHGETYLHPQDLIWWSRGGTLRGQSPPRIAFLRRILEEGPAQGLEPIDKWQDARTAGRRGEYYLIYFGKEKPSEWAVELPRTGINGPVEIQIDLIDTWNMTVLPLPGRFVLKPSSRYRLSAEPSAQIKLPGVPYMAIRIRANPA